MSCILEILRSERGLEVLKPLWPKVIVGLGVRVASTNDVARAGAINALTQWIRSALPFTSTPCLFPAQTNRHTPFFISRRHFLSRTGPPRPCAGPANAAAHRLRDETISWAALDYLHLVWPDGFKGLWNPSVAGWASPTAMMRAVCDLVSQRCAEFSTWLLARTDEFTLEALQVATTAPHSTLVAPPHHTAAGSTRNRRCHHWQSRRSCSART